MTCWYPDLPAGWSVGRVKSVAEAVTDGAHVSPETAGGVYAFVSTRDVKGGRIDFAGALRTSAETYKYMVTTGCKPAPGDVLFSKDGTVGETAVVREDRDFVVASSLVIITPNRSRIMPDYLGYVLSSKIAKENATSMMRGAGLPRLSVGNLARVEVPIPPLPEQRAIAAYLDCETARIEDLIAEQQRLIDLLRERRHALLARETRWGSDLPDGWESQRLSWLFNSTGSGTTPAPQDSIESSEETIPWVTTGELRERMVTLTARGVLPATIATYSALRIHPAGSLLIAMYGATIGRMGILGVPATCNQACCALVHPRDVRAEFAQYSLLAARPYLLLDAAGGGQPNINQEKIRAFRIPVPSLDEQDRIVRDLDVKTEVIDRLVKEADRLIELARERRSALITEAVTGQIDVRRVA